MSIVIKTLREIISDEGIFTDGDWIESKDQDPNGDVRLIQLADIGVGRFLNKSKRFMTSAKAKELRCTFLKPGDILLARMPEPIGRACIFPGDSKKCVTVVDICIIRPNSGSIDNRWLVYLINSTGFNNSIIQYITGTTRKRISRGNLSKIKINTPPLLEQKRIAKILDRADQLRQKREKSLELADQFLRSVFLEMFGDPVINPKGWCIKKFDDLGAWSSGGTPSRKIPEYFMGDINWFSAGELNDRYVSKSNEKITEEAVKNSSAKIFPEGSLLIGMYDTAAFKISILKNDASSNQACACLIPNEKINIEWLYTFIDISKNYYLRFRRGVRQKNLNQGMIRNFDLPVPPKSLQDKFGNIAVQLQNIIEKKKKGKLILDNLFFSLSQKAFKGELSRSSKELHLSDPEEKSASEELAELKTEVKEDKEEVKEVTEKIRLPEGRLNQELQKIETLFQQSSLAESTSIESFQAYLESLVDVFANDESVDQLQLTLDEFSLSFGLTEDLEQELKRIEEEIEESELDAPQQSSIIDFKDFVSYFIAQNDKKNWPSFASVITYFNSLGYRGLLVYEQLKTMIFESLKIGWLTQVSQENITSIQELNTALDSMIAFKIDN